MQYHLDTIPVWEAMEWKMECPLCGLEHKTEAEEIKRALGASVMEPSVRIEFNQRGVCREHQPMLFHQQNRLGHALLMDSHAKEQLVKLEKLQKQADADSKGRTSLFSKGSSVDSILDVLHDMNEHCVVCEAIATHMARYHYTFLHLWKTNADFQAAWKGSHGVCLPHSVALLESAQKHLNLTQQNALAAELLGFLTQHLSADEQDLDWFTRKFDYRNQDAPWGNSKTALERVVNRLRGWCIGDTSYPKRNNHTAP